MQRVGGHAALYRSCIMFEKIRPAAGAQYPQSSRIETSRKIYLKRGFWPIPLIEDGKRPIVKSWTVVSDTDYSFSPKNNMGILTGVNIPNKGPFLAVDIDVSRIDPRSLALNQYIVGMFDSCFGKTSRVLTGGSHRGTHLYYCVDEAILGKVEVKFSFFDDLTPTVMKVEVLCKNASGDGFNIVAVPSFVEAEYCFENDEDIEAALERIATIKKNELLELLESEEMKTTQKLVELSSYLGALRKNGFLSGNEIDFSVSAFLVQNGFDDERQYHLCFRLIYGDDYDQSTSEFAMERTREMVDTDQAVQGIGSIITSLEEEESKCLQQIVDKFNPPDQRLIVSKPKVESASSVNEEEGDNALFYITQCDQTNDTIHWLIERILPSSRFLLLHGFPGCGKTTTACKLAEIYLRNNINASVLYFNLEGKGGDIEEKLRCFSESARSRFLVVNQKKQFDLFDPSNTEAMYDLVKERVHYGENSVPIVIIDSLMAAVGGKLSEGKIAGPLMLFNKLSKDFDITVILVHHNNKGKDESGRERIFGSTLISGAVVVSFEVSEVNNCEFAKKLTVTKSNMSDLPIKSQVVVGQIPGRPPTAFRVGEDEVIDPSTLLLIDQCRNNLLEQLVDGEPKLSTEVRANLDHEYSESTITRASKQLGIRKQVVDGKRVWFLAKDSIIHRLL